MDSEATNPIEALRALADELEGWGRDKVIGLSTMRRMDVEAFANLMRSHVAALARPSAAGAVLRDVDEIFRTILPKFNWSADTFDAADLSRDEIDLLNAMPNAVQCALRDTHPAPQDRPSAAGDARDALDLLDTACTAYNKAAHEWSKQSDPDEPRNQYALRAVVAALTGAQP